MIAHFLGILNGLVLLIHLLVNNNEKHEIQKNATDQVSAVQPCTNLPSQQDESVEKNNQNSKSETNKVSKKYDATWNVDKYNGKYELTKRQFEETVLHNFMIRVPADMESLIYHKEGARYKKTFGFEARSLSAKLADYFEMEVNVCGKSHTTVTFNSTWLKSMIDISLASTLFKGDTDEVPLNTPFSTCLCSTDYVVQTCTNILRRNKEYYTKLCFLCDHFFLVCFYSYVFSKPHLSLENTNLAAIELFINHLSSNYQNQAYQKDVEINFYKPKDDLSTQVCIVTLRHHRKIGESSIM